MKPARTGEGNGGMDGEWGNGWGMGEWMGEEEGGRGRGECYLGFGLGWGSLGA